MAKFLASSSPSVGRMVLSRLLVWLALACLALAGWMRYRFGDQLSFDAILSNVPGVGGQGAGNADLVPEAVLVVVILPAAAVLIGSAVLALVRRGGDGPRRLRMMIPAGAFMLSLGILLSVAGVPRQAVALLSKDSFAEYYTEPQVLSSPDKPLNMITLYLESIEDSFSDEDVFGENLLAELDEATEDFARYDGLHQYPEGGWTMAGIVATQCGIPLKSSLMGLGADPNAVGEQAEQYLPGAVCVGDVLAEHGYTNTYLGGADTEFAGKQTYLQNHGYDDVWGLKTWRKRGVDPDQTSAWGLSDHALFDRAREVLTDLDAKDDPFHLTMLTLDTHEPAGIFPGCDQDDPVRMASGIKCSMQQVHSFLDDIVAEYGDDTVIVVVGDHLKGTAGASDYKEEMASFDERIITLRVWSPKDIVFNRESTDQFSMAATSLELLGFELAGGRAGLGVSLVGDHSLDGTALGLPPEEYESAVTARSADLYRQLWQGTLR